MVKSSIINVVLICSRSLGNIPIMRIVPACYARRSSAPLMDTSTRPRFAQLARTRTLQLTSLVSVGILRICVGQPIPCRVQELRCLIRPLPQRPQAVSEPTEVAQLTDLVCMPELPPKAEPEPRRKRHASFSSWLDDLRFLAVILAGVALILLVFCYFVFP